MLSDTFVRTASLPSIEWPLFARGAVAVPARHAAERTLAL